jgi:hypothetical protein
MLLPNNQRRHRTLHIEGRAALRIVLVTVTRVNRSCERASSTYTCNINRL